MVKRVLKTLQLHEERFTLLRQVINKISSDIKLDSKAETPCIQRYLEQVLRDLQSAGNAGEFYTPARLHSLLLKWLRQSLAKQCWTLCGTAGFLTNVIDFIEKTRR